MKENLLVSSCLLGNNCKYNGKNNLNNEVIRLKEKYHLIAICPETLGGLISPRVPSEIRDGKVYSKDNIDVTTMFFMGAEKTLLIAKKYNCTKAVLKERSPSCGVHFIYDGSFGGKCINGLGITAKVLQDNGIEIFSEFDLDKL